VQILGSEEKIIAVAKVKLGARQMKEQIARKNTVAAHADDIVIF
jgi:glutamate 5-kinase